MLSRYLEISFEEVIGLRLEKTRTTLLDSRVLVNIRK